MIENPLMLGVAAGIVGGLVVFFTTLGGIYGNSKAYKFFEQSVWKSYGYSKSWKGAFVGLILGFVYAGLIVGITAWIYNWFL